jgi:hypothetical protein
MYLSVAAERYRLAKAQAYASGLVEAERYRLAKAQAYAFESVSVSKWDQGCL